MEHDLRSEVDPEKATSNVSRRWPAVAAGLAVLTIVTVATILAVDARCTSLEEYLADPELGQVTCGHDYVPDFSLDQ